MAFKKRTPKLDLNPSAADRWTTCTASPRFILECEQKGMLGESVTAYNQEGTTAHEVAAALLQDRKPREHDKYHCPVPVTEEMHVHAWSYLQYIESLREPGAQLLVEQKLPLWYMEGRNAIVDAALMNRDSLHVIDLKYGEGVIVSPEGSLQGTIYTKSIQRAKDFIFDNDFPITIHIYQPRGRAAEDAPTHKWQTVWGEIEKLSHHIFRQAVNVQQDIDTKFAPSEKACQWCPAKGFCEAREKWLQGDVSELTNLDAILPSTNVMTVERMAAVVRHGDKIVKWINEVKAYALTYMKAGNKLPGFKLVTSRGGNRTWMDPKKAAKLLVEQTILKREEVIKETTIGPAEAEKLLGKNKVPKDLVNLITKAPGWPVIALEDDKRESCFLDASSEFENLDLVEF